MNVAQYIFAGLMLGMSYAVVSIGITLIFSVMKMINFSMGDFFTIGCYLQYAFTVMVLGPQYWPIGILLAAIITGIIGALCQRVLIRPMYNLKSLRSQMDYAIIITFGLALFIRNFFVVLAGPYYFRPPDHLRPIQLLDISISGNRLVAFLVSAVVICTVYIFLKKTWMGKAFRATAGNRDGAKVVGINPHQVDQLTFAVSVALAAVAGALLAPVNLVYPTAGGWIGIKGFNVVVIGGMGSIPGALIASFLLGMVESLGGAYISTAYREVYGFILVIFFLLLRPRGLLGERERQA